MPEIRLENIKKRYPGTDTDAIENLNLVIPEGEFMCLLGPSGCGKTTTLRMIAGLENPTAGTINIGTNLVDAPGQGKFVPPEKRNLGLVFQNYALWPHLTVQENVEFGLKINRENKTNREVSSQRVMTTLGIERFADRYPSELSGGQQQRVALARMLAVNPDVLLLDEPLSNLDAKLRLEMRSELKRIHDEFRTTIVFVTHDQWEAMTLSTSIAVMSEGHLQQVGTPEEIYDRPANRFVAEFIGNPPINILERSHPEDERLFYNLLNQSSQLSDDTVASIGIRPESIQILEENAVVGESNVKVSGIISAILPTGGSWILELLVDTSTIFAATMSKPFYEQGQEVFISIRVDDLQVFDHDGQSLNQVLLTH